MEAGCRRSGDAQALPAFRQQRYPGFEHRAGRGARSEPAGDNRRTRAARSGDGMSMPARRNFVCALDEILDGAGVCALIDGEQVALLRVGDEVFALENRDPFSEANVISRGLTGDLQGQLVVASPVYKQHFNLRTGRCLEDESVSLRTWPCGVLDSRVWVESLLRATGTARGRRRLVVVGNGMAAMRTVEELLKEAPDTYEITIFGAEP